MTAIGYTITATLPDQRTAAEYLAWLNGHVDQVVAHGAESASIVRIVEPDAPIQVEARYTFADRAAFDRYLAAGAPALRAEGLARFPPARGIRFDRRVGEVVR